MMKCNSLSKLELEVICGPQELTMGDSEVKSRHNYHFQFQTGRDVAIWRPLSDRKRECLDGGPGRKG